MTELQTATFGAGCFWGVEQAFREVSGVKDVTVGYTGGSKDNPTYKDVCTGQTGHAEVAQVEFDSNEVSYEALLDAFWKMHDPTTEDRQGPDHGSQYRSAIFYHTPEQKTLAEKSKKELNTSGKYSDSIVTEIIQVSTFWPAEEYHQRYFEKNGGGVCH